MRNFPIAADALPYLLILGFIAIISYLLYPPISILLVFLMLFVMFFFRNPVRKIPPDENIVLSPADGTILDVSLFYDHKYLLEEGIKVSIFLNIFNVHINRTPIAGVVKFQAYHPGKFIPAFKSHASEVNERNYVGIANEKLKVLIIQITGFVARRIVWWVKVGDQVELGERFGLIKFGSCTEVIVPKNVDILVKKGDKVRGGETLIGRLKDV